MDLASGYYQVELHPDDRHKTAFTTGTELYEFNVMPMGLSNSPSTFSRLMEIVLKGIWWKKVVNYLDDVLVFGKKHFRQTRQFEGGI